MPSSVQAREARAKRSMGRSTSGSRDSRHTMPRILVSTSVGTNATLSEATWPGYTVSVASYVCSLLDPQVVADLELTSFGYEAYRKDPASFTPLADGRSLLLGADNAANAREIAAFDERDIAGLLAFEREAARL